MINVKGYSFELENNTKVKLITKPTQSGKTFEMFKCLIELSKLYENQNCFNFIFCDNSLLQTNQLSQRFKNIENLKSYEDKEGNKSVIFSSKSKKTKKLDSIIHLIASGKNFKNIICCSNKPRYSNLEYILTELDNINFICNIFIDEADKFISGSLFHFFESFRKNEKVINFTLITATPEKIIKKYKEFLDVRIIKNPIIEKLYQSVYDVEFINYELNDGTIEYSKKIIRSEKCNIGDVWFIPSNTKVEHHILMKDMLCNFDFKVFVINGNGVNFYTSKENYIDVNQEIYIDENIELATKLGVFYEKNNLVNEKIAITGNICINRGITLNSKKMLLTHGILSPKLKKPDNIYQLAGRMFGNIKKMKIYNEKFANKKQIIYCNSYIEDVIFNGENNSVNIANGKLQLDNFSNDEMNNKKYLTVPIVIRINKNNFISIFEKDGDRKKKIKKIVKYKNKNDENNVDYQRLKKYFDKKYKLETISCPERNTLSYKRHIEDIVRKYKNNEVFMVDNKNGLKNQNYIHCFGDKINHKLCFVIWEGDKYKNM